MPRARMDQTVCRYCRQREPVIKLRLIKGLPVGECSACNTKRNLDLRIKKRFHLGLYTSTPELVAAVLKTLAGLKLGVYALLSNVTKARIGFIVVKDGSVYIDAWGNTNLYAYKLFELASILGNQGLFVDPKAIELKDIDGNGIAPDSIGHDLPREEPGNAMVWFDQSLLEHAIGLVRDELKQSKQLNAAIARSKIPIKSDTNKASK